MSRRVGERSTRRFYLLAKNGQTRQTRQVDEDYIARQARHGWHVVSSTRSRG